MVLVTGMFTVLAQPAPAASAQGVVGAAPGRPYTNPIKTQKGADPRLTHHEGDY